MLFGKAFEDITLDDLQRLVEERVSEHRRLDFKRDHYGRNDEAKVEFAADVSCMANREGGLLLIGVDEDAHGVATDVCGVEAPSSDRLISAVTESLRSNIDPAIFGVDLRWLPMTADRGVLMIRIPRSWDAPHRVTFKNHGHFYIRDETSKHRMTVTELRRAFLFGAEVEDRIRRFRTERLELLAADEGPLALAEGPRLVIHVVPRAAFTDGVRLEFGRHEQGLEVIGGRLYSMRSIDGFATYCASDLDSHPSRGFSTLFHDGQAEYVRVVSVGESGGAHRIQLVTAEQDVVACVQDALDQYPHRHVPLPVFVMVSLMGVKGLMPPPDLRGIAIDRPCRRPRLLLPELQIDDREAAQPVATTLRPILDLMWNGFGRPGSPNYDKEGKYGVGWG